jgi:hypothetical protein
MVSPIKVLVYGEIKISSVNSPNLTANLSQISVPLLN